jgi:predicted transcriptional regulator
MSIMSESTTSRNFIELSADIVSAYVSNNSVPASELPTLLSSIYAALAKTIQAQSQKPQAELMPAVPVKKSVTADAIICLEDGKKFKSLKRHLRTTYDMTPEQYRAKWGLPADYPMSRRTMPRRAPSLPGLWGSVSSAGKSRLRSRRLRMMVLPPKPRGLPRRRLRHRTQ